MQISFYEAIFHEINIENLLGHAIKKVDFFVPESVLRYEKRPKFSYRQKNRQSNRSEIRTF